MNVKRTFFVSVVERLVNCKFVTLTAAVFKGLAADRPSVIWMALLVVLKTVGLVLVWLVDNYKVAPIVPTTGLVTPVALRML